jgi:hypothetical protein
MRVSLTGARGPQTFSLGRPNERSQRLQFDSKALLRARAAAHLGHAGKALELGKEALHVRVLVRTEA